MSFNHPEMITPYEVPVIDEQPRNLIIVVRADPIICGHSTEARNLAEAAISDGWDSAHIVTWPMEHLRASGLPLKPESSIMPYSEGITVHRPEPVGGYKVLDGRHLSAMTGKIVELARHMDGEVVLMSLYLAPHADVTARAAATLARVCPNTQVTTIAEAVGSDITDVVRNALADGDPGAAANLLATYLDHDRPVAVSAYTRDEIVRCAADLDTTMQTRFAEELAERVRISFPAIDASAYLAPEREPEAMAEVMAKRQVEQGRYLLFLSRLAPAKGADDLIHAYRASSACRRLPLLIAGNGPHEATLRELIGEDPWIRLLTDVGDEEKPYLLAGAAGYVLPSKPRPEFVETFGIAIAEKMLAGGGVVITTETGGIPEATGGHCLTIEPDNIADLRDKLDQLMAMPADAREQLIAEARAYAMQFDRAAVLRNLIEAAAAAAA